MTSVESYIWSTVGKQAKRMPDTTVETTKKECKYTMSKNSCCVL